MDNMCPLYLLHLYHDRIYILAFMDNYTFKKNEVIETIWPFLYSLRSLNSKQMSLVGISLLIIKCDCDFACHRRS